jgi:hypothetical protein
MSVAAEQSTWLYVIEYLNLQLLMTFGHINKIYIYIYMYVYIYEATTLTYIKIFATYNPTSIRNCDTYVY